MSENKTHSRQFKADATLKVFLEMMQGEAVTYPWSAEELDNFSRWTGISKEELKNKTAEELEKLAPLVFTGTARQEKAVIYIEPTQLEGYEPNTTVAYVNGKAVDIASTYFGALKIEVSGLEVGSVVEFAIPAGYHCLGDFANKDRKDLYDAKELKCMSRAMLEFVSKSPIYDYATAVYVDVKSVDENALKYIIAKSQDKLFCSLFAFCRLLQSIPEGLFAGVRGSASSLFAGTFHGCSSLTTLPKGLFAGVRGSAIFMFHNTFLGCSSLSSLPEGLFAGVSGSARAMFQSTFYGCSSLTTLPDGLFAGVSGSASSLFAATFSDCTSLSSLPDGLFAGVSGSADSMFDGTFSRCISLSSLPEGLFAGVSGICRLTFRSTFERCTSLISLPEHLFGDISKDSIFAFNETFNGCVSLTGTTPKVQGKRLWEVLFEHKGIGYGCFKDCTKLSDYNEIPDKWKR